MRIMFNCDLIQNSYALKFSHVFANLCELRIDAERINSVMVEHCSDIDERMAGIIQNFCKFFSILNDFELRLYKQTYKYWIVFILSNNYTYHSIFFI